MHGKKGAGMHGMKAGMMGTGMHWMMGAFDPADIDDPERADKMAEMLRSRAERMRTRLETIEERASALDARAQELRSQGDGETES